jgi:hypothetical protein
MIKVFKDIIQGYQARVVSLGLSLERHLVGRKFHDPHSPSLSLTRLLTRNYATYPFVR